MSVGRASDAYRMPAGRPSAYGIRQYGVRRHSVKKSSYRRNCFAPASAVWQDLRALQPRHTARALQPTARVSMSPASRRLVVAGSICVGFGLFSYAVRAAVALSKASAYTQNFDGMGIPATSTTPSTLPADFKVDAQPA